MMVAFSDLHFWFGTQPSELWNMTIPELQDWVKEMNRQINAKYSKF